MDWIPNFLRRRKLYEDLSEEMQLHLEERAEQLMAEGMSPQEAQAAGTPRIRKPSIAGRAQPRLCGSGRHSNLSGQTCALPCVISAALPDSRSPPS